MRSCVDIIRDVLGESYDHDHYKKWADKNDMNHTDKSCMNKYAREVGLSPSEKKRQASLCAIDDHHNSGNANESRARCGILHVP